MGGRGDDRGGDAGDAAGGEVAMSIEETNKLRISLGLKPLQETEDTDQAAKDEHKKRKRAEEDAANTADLEERVRSTRERRKQQQLLNKTKTLGEAEPEVDDVMAWVNKSRKVEEKSNTEATWRPTRSGKNVENNDDEIEEAGVDALAGAKVKFGVDDLEAGEEMILTLEDRGILDDKGQLIDDEDLALENILKREDKQRAKAFANSRKTAKPLWEEDGQIRGLLDKYDQEEEEAFQLDDAGAIEASKLKRQDDIRAKLAAAKANGVVSGDLEANAATGVAPGGGNSDFYTPEEMAAMRKPKKKKERKLKKKALTADELAALEEAAAAAVGDGDLGSRADRERRAAERTAAVGIADQERRARFDAALSKANYASLALKASEEDQLDNEEEDEDLYRSLQKARELAAKKTQQQQQEDRAGGVLAANQFIKRRENETGAVPLPGGGLTFTDIGEFTRGITVKEENGAVPVKIAPDALKDEDETAPVGVGAIGGGGSIAVKKENDDTEMTKIEEEMDIQTFAPMEEDQKPVGASNDGAWGNWMPAAEVEAAAAAAADGDQKAKRSYRRNRATDDDDDRTKNTTTDTTAVEASIGSEKTIGSGLAGALAFLKERGELKAPVEWAGRTNDHRDSYFTKAMGNLEDVYSGGRTEDRLALDVEVALTKKDEFGRILTPKEAFRQLCHDFHGIKPSRNSKEKRAKQIAKELAQRKVATGGVGGTLEGLKAVQEAAATPYMVLSGTVRPGQSRDATSGYATVDRSNGSFGAGNGGIGSVPRLGGEQGPPLTGKAKVEAMLGMGPPPPRPPQQQQKHQGAGPSRAGKK